MTTLRLNDMERLERQGWDSLCNATGGDFYAQLMTDDGLMILVNGAAMDRDAVVASLSDAPSWDSYDITDMQLIDLGPEAAAVVYRAPARRGEEPPFRALMSSTYRIIDGEPRLALYQQTAATD